MKLETFFEKFDRFADAPNAVAKMRELVLQLALNGKLVGLDSAKWERVQLGTLGAWGSGGTPLRSEPQYYGGEIPWLVIGDLNDGVVTSATTFITEEGLSNSSARLLPQGVLLIAMYGSIGKLGITGIECATNQAIAFCKPDISRVDLRYLFHTLKGIQPALLARGQGLAQKNISQTILKAWEIALPPLIEQKRIVAKVDELMALCDRLEAQQQERDTRHAALARASLARFAEAPTPANLDFLFHPSYAITPADLRKSILTLAVQGKLVPQDPNDGPVELLDASRVTKAVSSISPDDVPFELPITWRWVQLGQVCELINGDRSKNYPNKVEYVREGVPWINTGHIEPDGTLSVDSMHYITRKKYDSLRSGKVRLGDLVYCLRGATLGKTAIITQFEEGAVASSLVIIRFSKDVDPKFAYRFLTSPLGREQIFKFDNGSAQPNLSANSVKKYLLPLPPLAEQRRIVAKVDQLMVLVDQLECQLTEANSKSAALLEAVVHELLTPSAEVINLASYRAAIGCYTIRKMSQQPYFGRTTAMKSLYLGEACVGLNLRFQPEREAAGPLDHWIYRFEEEGKQKEWFKAVENTSNGKMKVEYQPGKMLAAQAAQAEMQLTQYQRKEFDRLLDLLSDKKTEEVEIIATLFAAWNDFLIDGHAPRDDEIVTEVRENWHVKKERFTPTQLRQWLGWLRQHNLVPQGRLPHTVHQSSLSLN